MADGAPHISTPMGQLHWNLWLAGLGTTAAWRVIEAISKTHVLVPKSDQEGLRDYIFGILLEGITAADGVTHVVTEPVRKGWTARMHAHAATDALLRADGVVVARQEVPDA